MIRKRSWRTAGATASIVVVAAIGGCGGGIEQVRMYTAGAAVAADDGSFRIEGEAPAPPPFVITCGRGPNSPLDLGDAETLARDPALGLRHGARRVRVTTPNGSEPLYGLLAICNMSGRRPKVPIYSIAIPLELETQAREGRVVVVKEAYDGLNYWVLWLSSTPL